MISKYPGQNFIKNDENWSKITYIFDPEADSRSLLRARMRAPSDYVGLLLSWKPAHRVTTLHSCLLEVLPSLRGEEDRHAPALAVHEERPLLRLRAGVRQVVAAARTVRKSGIT